MTISKLKELVNSLELSEGNREAEVMVNSASGEILNLHDLVWEDEAAEFQLTAVPA